MSLAKNEPLPEPEKKTKAKKLNQLRRKQYLNGAIGQLKNLMILIMWLVRM